MLDFIVFLWNAFWFLLKISPLLIIGYFILVLISNFNKKARRHQEKLTSEAHDRRQAAMTLRGAADSFFESMAETDAAMETFRAHGMYGMEIKLIDITASLAQDLLNKIQSYRFPPSYEMQGIEATLANVLAAIQQNRKISLAEADSSRSQAGTKRPIGSDSGARAAGISIKVNEALLTLGISIESLVGLTEKKVDSRFRALMHVAHSDHGGEDEWARMLNEARRVVKDYLKTKALPV